MANKKKTSQQPPNAYDKYGDWTDNQKAQAQIFGIDTSSSNNSTPTDTTIYDDGEEIMIPENVVQEEFLDEEETLEEIFDSKAENVNPNPALGINKTQEKLDRGSLDEAEPLPELNTSSPMEKAIRNAVSEFRETTDGKLITTEEDIAFDEEKAREFRERTALNAEISEMEHAEKTEEAIEALNEALEAQQQLDELASFDEDISGNKKSKSKKSTRRKLPNNNPVTYPINSLDVKPPAKTENFTHPEISPTQVSPHKKNVLNKTVDNSPSDFQSEGYSSSKKSTSASSDAENFREDSANQANSISNLSSQTAQSGTIDVKPNIGATDTIIPNTASPIIYDNNYISKTETFKVATSVPEEVVTQTNPETKYVTPSSFNDMNSQPTQIEGSITNEQTYKETKNVIPRTPENAPEVNSEISPSTSNYELDKKFTYSQPDFLKNNNEAQNQVNLPSTTKKEFNTTEVYKNTPQERSYANQPNTLSSPETHILARDAIIDSSNPSYGGALPQTEKTTPKTHFDSVTNQSSAVNNNDDVGNKVNATSQKDTLPLHNETANLFVEAKSKTPSSIENIQFKPHYSSVGQVVSNANNVVPAVKSNANNSYIEEVKRSVSAYVSSEKDVIVTETGSYITVTYDNHIVSIPKSPDIKPATIPVSSQSPAFDSLVKKALNDVQTSMPPVYSGNDVRTTEVVSAQLSNNQVSSQWNINELNDALKQNLGATVMLHPTEKSNVYSVFKGTDNEAYITFHPVSHRVTDVKYVSENPSQVAIKDISAIQNSANSYADYCRTTENAHDYIAKRFSQPQAKTQNSTAIKTAQHNPITPINRAITNATQLPIEYAPKLTQKSFGSISTSYATTFNPYTSVLSSGAVATRLRNSYTMVMPDTFIPRKGIAPEIGRLISLQEQSVIADFGIDENIIGEPDMLNTTDSQIIDGTSEVVINDPSRATKLADKVDVISPNQFYSAINPAYNLSPLRSQPNFKPLFNSTRGLGLMVAMQIRQTAMQNPIGEGMQQMSTYTLLPLRMFHKNNPYAALTSGLKHLPNYNSAVTTYIQEVRALGINCNNNPTLFEITNISNRVYANARTLGFEPSQLTQTQIASELVKRQKWLANPSQRPAGKSVELINKEMNSLKALSSAKQLHLSKTNVSAFYIEYFKNNGIVLPPNITDLTDKGQLAMLRSIVDNKIGGKYGIKDISQMSPIRLESLMKTYKFTEKELNVLRLLATPEMSRFSQLMKKADRRSIYFMLFLQRVFGQNDAIQGAIKTVRWLRNVRLVIHYTRRVSQLSQKMLGRLAHRHGWDKIIEANRNLTRRGRAIKNAPKKAGKAVGKAVKKGAQSASKNLAKTAVGKTTKKVTNKIAQSTIGKVTKNTTQAITKASAKVASKISAITAKKAAIEASVSETISGALGLGGGASATVASGAGASGAAGSVAGGASAGGGIAAGGWIALLVVLVIAVIFILYVTVIPLISQSVETDREQKTYETVIDGLTQLDNLYINAMKDIRITHLEEEGDSENFFTLPIGESEAERFDVTGYYDPTTNQSAILKQWGWNNDAKEKNSIPANNTVSTLVPSFKNSLYEAHNRGAVFTFTDSPQKIYYLHSDSDTGFSYDTINNPDVKETSFRSNVKEIISAVSVITQDEYTNASGSGAFGLGKDYADLIKGYSYSGIRVAENNTDTALNDSVTSVSLWSATHGYQTTASDVYACNGCKDFSYYCNSDEWKMLNNNSNFKFNKSTLTTLSGNAKALPYNEKGCYQHSTKSYLSDKSNKEYFCNGYHKTLSGYYIQCTSNNNKGIYSGVVGHTYTDIYGTNTISGHNIMFCNNYEIIPAGTKTTTESCYIQDKQYYSHTCPDFNVKGCSDAIDVSNIFGTTAYLITQSDFGIGGDFDRPRCVSYSGQFKVTHGSESTTYRLVYCTGHHNCNTNTIEVNSEPIKKTISQSFYIYYGNNTNDKATFIVDGVSSKEPTFVLTVNDYCMHYKTTTNNVSYELAKKVCNGHCDRHTKNNNDHPCVYCIGHRDKLVTAYVISSLNPDTQPSKLYNGEEGHWDCLPFNTIYSADTCSGPIALAREGYVSDNVVAGIADNRDAEWYLSILNYKEWYANENALRYVSTQNKEKRKEIAINSSNNIRQNVSNKLLTSWNEAYKADIFSKTQKTANGIFYGEYFGYFSSNVDTEWSYIENQILKRETTEQQKAFVRWAIESCGKVPYYPSGTINGKWYENNTNKDVNGFGKKVSPDSAGRILYGVNESKWLNWCYASAFSSSVIQMSDGSRYYINPLAPKLNSSSVSVNNISLNTNYKFTPTGCSNLPNNAKHIIYNDLNSFREGIQAGDIIVLKKKCPLCSKMFSQGSTLTKCDNCDIEITQDFAIVIGWADYAKSICKNINCSDYEKGFKNETNCPSCDYELERSTKAKGDDIFVIEMSSDACEENVVLKRYDERAFDVSSTGLGNKYVVYRFLN